MTSLLFTSQVPDYLYMKYSVRRVRRTITYWITDGLLVNGKRIFLKTRRSRDGQLYTRCYWVDEFIEKLGERDRV